MQHISNGIRAAHLLRHFSVIQLLKYTWPAAHTLFPVVSSLIGNSRTISPWEGWTEPSILWSANVGSPSSGKSPAMSPVLDILRELEQELIPEFEECLRQHKAVCLTANMALEEWEGTAKANAKGGRAVSPVPVDAVMPVKPERPRLSTTDATIEAMLRMGSL